MNTKPRSRGTFLFSAICWTITTILWTVTITMRAWAHLYSWLLLLQVIVLLLSLLNTVLNWYRYANYNKKYETIDITGGIDHE